MLQFDNVRVSLCVLANASSVTRKRGTSDISTCTQILNPGNIHFGFLSITAKAALKFGSEAWVLKKREEQRLEAAQIKFLRHLVRITKLDKEKNQCITEKNGSTERSKGNKTVP